MTYCGKQSQNDIDIWPIRCVYRYKLKCSINQLYFNIPKTHKLYTCWHIASSSTLSCHIPLDFQYADILCRYHISRCHNCRPQPSFVKIRTVAYAWNSISFKICCPEFGYLLLRLTLKRKRLGKKNALLVSNYL